MDEPLIFLARPYIRHFYNSSLSMEAAWGECQHAIDRITSPPADNSPPLPWWDKQRMKMRGKIISKSKESNWHHLASRFPYC